MDQWMSNTLNGLIAEVTVPTEHPSERNPHSVPAPAYEPLRGTAETMVAAPQEQGMEEDLDRIRSKLALWDAKEEQLDVEPPPAVQPFRPSDRVYVLGLDAAGRFIAHTLAGSLSIPPVRYLFHKRYLSQKWKMSEKKVTLFRGHESAARSRIIPEYMPEEAELEPEDLKEEVIYNLVVTVSAAQAVQAIGRIKHRIDYRTSICLVNDGLGVAEAVIEAHFPNEASRPSFILGHLTTKLHKMRNRFSVTEVRPGRLYLSLFSPEGRGVDANFAAKRHPPLPRITRATHFLRILTAMPGLNATGHPMPDFLLKKLPLVAFRTIVDPLAALLDCRYEDLRGNAHARVLMDRLMGELGRVVSKLPECRDSQRLKNFVLSGELREEVLHKLMLQRTANSMMRAQVGLGWDTDVEYLSGYFVKRGQEVKAGVTALDSIMWGVKAKQIAVLRQLARGEIPFEEVTSKHRETKMDDSELDRIRKARLEQLKAQGGGSKGGPSAGGNGQEQAQRQQQEAEARKSILNQILEPEAADRLGRIRLVKEQRATDIENRLIMLAQTGQIRQKVSETQLKELLNAVADNKEEEKIVVSRRKGWEDDDDDLLISTSSL
ncbi:hypothetical protein N0V88_003618 [Collariella sp. IMI 366227]|nr:hypothetical protein N0V88_003618 [Collariella sp. IMI 366227]